jgi:tRNA 2-thiouridine synthesizing protein D
VTKSLTIILLSGYQENEDALFAVRLADAVLDKGYGVFVFLFGNGCNIANKEKPVQPPLRITDRLLKHLLRGKIGDELERIARKGARVATCHTTEYGRGTEAEPYRDGVEWGDVGETFIDFLVRTNVLLTLGH